MSYSGAFVSHAREIVRLHREGRSAVEIAGLIPACGREWLRADECAPLSPQMVHYILVREGAVARGPMARNDAFLADFKRRWDKWGQRARLPMRELEWLYQVLGWIADEVEARKKAACDGQR